MSTILAREVAAVHGVGADEHVHLFPDGSDAALCGVTADTHPECRGLGTTPGYSYPTLCDDFRDDRCPGCRRPLCPTCSLEYYLRHEWSRQ